MNPPPRPAPASPLRPTPARPGVYRLDAALVLDGAGVHFAPGSMLVEVRPPAGTATRAAGPALEPDPSRPDPLAGDLRVLAVDTPGQIDTHPAARAARRIDLARAALLPPFVNAHTHLDLTHIGPQPHDAEAGFMSFIELVRDRRAVDPAEIEAAVRLGAELSLRAGVVAVGDIAGAPRGEPQFAPARAIAATPIRGVSFVEFFGIGKSEARGVERLEQIIAEARHIPADAAVRLGLQPHAPNTVAARLYARAARAATEHHLPICTHLAETPDERAFIAEARGPQRQLLERLGLWDDALLAELGRGRSPIAHLADILPLARWLAVHLNDCAEPDLEILARAGVTIAFCPRASAYFAAERCFGGHRYRDFLRAGIPVALGTDSIINLPPGCDAEGGPGLSILDEMRFLHRRDGFDASALLAMGTTAGASALGLDPGAFRFRPGGPPLAGLAAVNLAGTAPTPESVMRGRENPALLLIGN